MRLLNAVLFGVLCWATVILVTLGAQGLYEWLTPVLGEALACLTALVSSLVGLSAVWLAYDLQGGWR